MILSNSMHNIMNMPSKQGGKIWRRATGTKCNFPHSHFSGYALNNFCSFLRDFKWQKYFLGNMFLVLRFFGIWNVFFGQRKSIWRPNYHSVPGYFESLKYFVFWVLFLWHWDLLGSIGHYTKPFFFLGNYKLFGIWCWTTNVCAESRLWNVEH